MKEDRVKRK